MEIKSCVIFAVSVQKEERLYVLHEFMQLIKMYYSDCKIFIGINYGMHPDIESIIDSYELNVLYKRLSESSMYTASDDSAYQVALKLFYDDPVKYDVCWFMHTKGAFNERPTERGLYINNFYTKRLSIEDKFANLEHLGVYGYRAIDYHGIDPNNPVEPHITNRFMKAFWSESNIDNFNARICNVIIIETMFALKASLIYKFLDTYPEFFDTVIRMFFFECEISNFLSTRSGYYPAIVTGNAFTGMKMDAVINKWIADNQLTHLQEYNNLIKL